MRWYYLDFYGEDEPYLIEKISSLGLTGVGFPGKKGAHLRVYFKSLSERERVRSLLEGEFRMESGEEEDKDWIREVERGYEPVRAGSFVVMPSSLIPIIIKPGMAFGTGYHPSTKLALRLIDEEIKEPRGFSLDLGTGSGILAIALHRRGVKPIIALDKDLLALREARENFLRNDVQSEVALIGSDLLSAIKDDLKFEIVVANLLFPIFEIALPEIAKHIERGGIFIASGITARERGRFLNLIERYGFKLASLLEEEGWIGTAAILR
ncbi:MAG: 50S ribosomal protein L11 methyltransferase [Synergistetes bacterium]|nr:50S ribosomal protein L11 methyltransferase [Synergistota bacterium]